MNGWSVAWGATGLELSDTDSPHPRPGVDGQVQPIAGTDAEGSVPPVHIADVLVHAAAIGRVRIRKHIGADCFGPAFVTPDQGEAQKEALVSGQSVDDRGGSAVEGRMVCVKRELQSADVGNV